MRKKTWPHWQATVVYIALNELIVNSMQHAKDEWQPAKTPPWVFTSAASISFLPWAFLFCRELFFFAVSFSFLPWAFLFCRELFSFAVSFSFLPWAFLFCLELFFFAVSFALLPWAFLFCRELCSFAMRFSFLPWAFLFCRELFFIVVALVGHRTEPKLDEKLFLSRESLETSVLYWLTLLRYLTCCS